MKYIAALAALAMLSVSAPAIAVDNTISNYCAPENIADHANFCAAVANNKSLGTVSGHDTTCDEPDTVKNEDGECVAIVPIEWTAL